MRCVSTETCPWKRQAHHSQLHLEYRQLATPAGSGIFHAKSLNGRQPTGGHGCLSGSPPRSCFPGGRPRRSGTEPVRAGVLAAPDELIELEEDVFRAVGISFRVPARVVRILRASSCQERRVFDEDFIRASRWPTQSCSAPPGSMRRPTYFHRSRTAPSSSGRRLPATPYNRPCTVLKPEHDDAGILCPDGISSTSVAASSLFPLKVSIAPLGASARMDGHQIGKDAR